jgi:hypothetical protein
MRSHLTDPVHGWSPPSHRDARAPDTSANGLLAEPSSTSALGPPPGQVLADVPIVLGPLAPLAARELVAAVLVEVMPPALIERARLVVSELVTSSLLHSGAQRGGHVVVTLRAWAGRCRIDVQDPSHAGLIPARAPDPVDPGGMGLKVVASVSECWGVVRDGRGPRRTWAQLCCVDGLPDAEGGATRCTT